MNTKIRSLINSGKETDLAQLEIEGEPKGLGHGQLSFENHDKGTSIHLTQDLKIKAETEDGEILIVTGRPHEVAREFCTKVTMNLQEVLAQRWPHFTDP